MGNFVTSKKVPPGTASFGMSNGLADVFFDVLAIASSDRATTTWEKSFAYWVVRNDQTRAGRGCVGFDISEMGWTREDFDVQKRFVLSVIDAARGRSGWERLSFTPHDAIFDTLGEFRRMVDELPVTAAGAPPCWEWELPGGMCEKHRVYLHEVGCIICNDDGWV